MKEKNDVFQQKRGLGYSPKPPSLKEYWRARYPTHSWAKHIEYMINALEGLQPREGLILCVPPRHAKTTSTIAWMEWMLGQYPDKDGIYASYGVSLARKSSSAIRDQFNAGTVTRKYFPQATLAKGKQSSTDWMLSKGGYFRAAGVEGPLTGVGATFAVVDDPFKDRIEADSLGRQETVWEWFTQVLLTRLTPDARLVVMHTRWAEGDLVGRIKEALLQSENNTLGGLTWKIVELRALPEDDDPLGRAENEPLWPERYDLKSIEDMKRTDPYGFSALYQQRPRPKDDQVFGPPFFYTELPVGMRYGRGADLAYTKGTRSNHSCYYQLGERDGKYYLLAGDRWQDQIGGSINRLLAIQSRFPGPARMEMNGPQRGIFDTVQNAGVDLVGFNPVGDKYAGALPLIEVWNSGRLLLPAPEKFPVTADLVLTLVGIIARFTGSGNEVDDDIDALRNAVVQLQDEIGQVDFEKLSAFGIGGLER